MDDVKMDAPQITLSAPKYLQRPRDPLKDGSIFQMGRRMSQTGASQAYNDTRYPPSLCQEPAATSGGHQANTPSPGIAAAAGPGALHTHGVGDLSKSELARQIRANFDNLVRASPLPRAVERLVTPSAGRLAALAPPWLQDSHGSALQGAKTPQHQVQVSLRPPRPPLQFCTPGSGSVPETGPRAAPLSGNCSGQLPAVRSHEPGSLIRPIPIAPRFGSSADALYPPRTMGKQRDPRLSRSPGQTIHIAEPGGDQAQSAAAHKLLPQPENGSESQAVGGPAVSPASTEDVEIDIGEYELPAVSRGKPSAAQHSDHEAAGQPSHPEDNSEGGQPALKNASTKSPGAKGVPSDSERTVTAAAGAQHVREEECMQQEQSTRQGKQPAADNNLEHRDCLAATPPKSKEAEEARNQEDLQPSPEQWVPTIEAAEAQVEASDDAERQQQAPSGPADAPQAGAAGPSRDDMASAGQSIHGGPKASPAKDVPQEGKLGEQVADRQAAVACGKIDERMGRPEVDAGTAFNGPAESLPGRGQTAAGYSEAAGSLAQDSQPSAPAEDMAAAPEPIGAAGEQSREMTKPAQAPPAQKRGRGHPKGPERVKEEAVGSQVSWTGRVRVPPLAFWANERISRNATQTGGSAIEQGFSDQLAQACQSFTHSSPARKPKKATEAAEPGKGKESKQSRVQQQIAAGVQHSTAVAQQTSDKKRKQPEEASGLDALAAAAEAVADVADAAATPQAVPRAALEAMQNACAQPLEKTAPPQSKARSRAYQCEECRKKKKGHCGTDRAVKTCLRRGQTQGAQAEVREAAGQAGAGPQQAQQQGSAQAGQPGQPGRTLGIAAKLAALARRPEGAAGSPLPGRAGQVQGQQRPAPAKKKPGVPGVSKRSASLTALQQAEHARRAAKRSSSPGRQGTGKEPAREPSAAEKQASLPAPQGISGEARKDESAPSNKRRKQAASAPMQDSGAELGSLEAAPQIATSRKRNTQSAPLASAAKSSRKAISNTSSNPTDPPKRLSKAAQHNASSSGRHPQHDVQRTKAGTDNGQGRQLANRQGAPSRLLRLTKASSAAEPMREASAGLQDVSSGTSNEEGADKEGDEDVWSEAQTAALQRAYLIAEDPTAPNFWRNVAQHVPGKSAEECFARIWAAHPTPREPKKSAASASAYALAAEAASDDSPLQPPPRQHAGGRLKKPAPAATRKWARQVRWHERASQAACKAGVSNEQPEEAQPAPKAPVNPTLLAAMQQQQRTDRYIDTLIRRRGPLHKWAKGKTAKQTAPPSAAIMLSHPELQGAVAAIASATQEAGDEEEADEQASDHDQYWSDG